MTAASSSLRERMLLEELWHQRERSVAVLDELRALGVVDVTLSEEWHIENFFRFSPEETYRASDVADRVGGDQRSVRAMLGRLAQDGKISRVRVGVYAALRPAQSERAAKSRRVAEEEAPAHALRERIEDILLHSKEPRTVDEILTRLEFPRARAGLLVTYLAKLAREGHIQRVATGVYASKPRLPRPSPRAPLSLHDALHQLVACSRHAMTIEQIVVAMKLPLSRRAYALRSLAQLVDERRVRRVRAGIYASLETTTAPPLPSLTERLRTILEASGRAMTIDTLLRSAKVPPGQRKSAKRLLSRLASDGWVRRIMPGTYAPQTPLPPSTLKQRLHATLETRGRAMTLDQILRAAKVPSPEHGSASKALLGLVSSGVVRRVVPGTYAAFEETQAAPPPPPLTRRLRTLLEMSGRAMTLDALLHTANVPPRQRKSANRLLNRLVSDGHVHRVQPGIYAALTVAETSLAPSRPLARQLRVAVDRGGRAMTIAEILDEAHVPTKRRVSARAMLSALVQSGHIRRVETGVYASVQNATALDPPSMDASILAELANHPGGLDVATLRARVRADDVELDEAIRGLLRDKRVRRVRLGVYVATG